MAADSVAVNTPPTTPKTTMTTAASAQMEVPSCLMKPLMLKGEPLG